MKESQFLPRGAEGVGGGSRAEEELAAAVQAAQRGWRCAPEPACTDPPQPLQAEKAANGYAAAAPLPKHCKRENLLNGLSRVTNVACGQFRGLGQAGAVECTTVNQYKSQV